MCAVELLQLIIAVPYKNDKKKPAGSEQEVTVHFYESCFAFWKRSEIPDTSDHARGKYNNTIGISKVIN